MAVICSADDSGSHAPPQQPERAVIAAARHTRLVVDEGDYQDGLFAGVGYEYVSVVPSGSIVFTAGACPLDESGQVVGPNDPIAQAEQCVSNLAAALARAGGTLDDLVRTTIYVVGDRDELAAAWRTVAQRLLPHRPPSTLLGVRALGYKDQVVEIDGIAVLSAG
jgi:enamine deaminase RidA (YjgF/YER057c/UK114 family)